MFLGMDNGRIFVYSIINKGITLNEECEIKAHSKRVMGLAYEPENGHIMSISEDGKFKLSDPTSEEPVHEEAIGRGGLKCLIHDKFYKRVFIGDGDGTVHIISHVNYPPELISSVKSQSGSCIRGMCIDNDVNFLFTGDTNGFINCFDLGPVGKEKFIKQVSEMAGLSKIRYMVWTNENREIFTGNQSGKITVWDPEKGQSIFVLEAHENAITKMQWFEKSRYLMTASKEKSLCIWEIPKIWIKEDTPSGAPTDEEAKFRTKKLTQVLEEQKDEEDAKLDMDEPLVSAITNNEDAFAKMEQGFDPLGGGKLTKSKMPPVDDDDLFGWHK